MDAGQLRLIQPVLQDAYAELVKRSMRRELRPDTLFQYAMLWRGVCRDFSQSRPLSEIGGTEIQDWLDRIREKWSRATARCYRTYMSMLFNVSIQRELYAGFNPVRRTEPIHRDPYKPRRMLTDTEISALLQALRRENGVLGKMWTAFFQIMLLTGLRVREVTGLKWEDFFWQSGVFRPSHQKRSRGFDLLPITAELESVLAMWSGGGELTGLVFPETERAQSRHFCGRARRALAHFARLAGLSEPDRIGTHTLRRTFITHAAGAARGDHVALMEVARHRDLGTTRVYMPTVSKAVREVSALTARELGRLMSIQVQQGSSDDSRQEKADGSVNSGKNLTVRFQVDVPLHEIGQMRLPFPAMEGVVTEVKIEQASAR